MIKCTSFLLRNSIKSNGITFPAGTVVWVIDSKNLLVVSQNKNNGKKIILSDGEINNLLVENTVLNRSILTAVLKELKKQNEIIERIKSRWLNLPVFHFDNDKK